MLGKIIRYDGAKGEGSIIYKDRHTEDFNINNWHSFDVLPEIGLSVNVEDENITPVQASPEGEEHGKNGPQIENAKSTELIQRRDQYINSSVANGWKVESINDLGFVITNNQFEALPFVGWSALFSTLLAWPFGILGIFPALIVAYFITTSTGNYTLQGVMDYDEDSIHVTKKGKPYKTI